MSGTTTAIVLRVDCGQTLRTMVNGVAIEIECGLEHDDDGGGDPPPTAGWRPPPPPTGGGGVIAYTRLILGGSGLDLTALADRHRIGELRAAVLPRASADHDWAVFADDDGVGSLGPMTVELED